MSEECSDYIDCRAMLRDLEGKEVIEVLVTKHALKRLLERKPRKYKKVNEKVMANIILNIVRDGDYKAYTTNLFILD